ncbi:MAG: FHA domain-containing protein, partial [Rivularia sp. (in: cyanobacteria)]
MKLKISNSPTQSELEEIDLSSTTRRGVEYLIGRSPDSDLVLDSEDVSRHHGKFFSQSGNYYFSDLGSRNGTIINGKIAEKNHSYILKNGDIIRIGDFALMMEEDISVSEQSETVVRIIQPEMFSNRKGNQNTDSDVATPSEFVNQNRASQPVISESIANKIEKDEYVNTSEELTFVQSDEAFPANADIVIPNNAVELHEDNEISDANTISDRAEYTIVQTRDVLQEDDTDSEAEEIVLQNQKEDTQDDDIDSEAEEIIVQTQEEETQEDDIDSEAEEIVLQNQKEETQD